jgi:putative membrane-bound dehydrogenase-like protein
MKKPVSFPYRISQTLFSITIFLACLWGITESNLFGQEVASQDFADQLPRIPAVDPADVLTTFELKPGFRLQLVAAEPLIVDPVAIAFDETGAAFVVEMRGYSEHHEPLGTIRKLVDQDGDGIFDQSTVFTDKLLWPTAICCYDGGVIIGAAPDIVYCRDENGDGVADRREVWFTGFGRNNVQQLFNSFRWGLDNRIYCASGGNGGRIVASAWPDQAPLDLGRNDFVIIPDQKRIELIDGGGQHGASFDTAGNRFVSSNSDHIQQFVFENRYLARNPFFRAPTNRYSIAADGPAAEVFRISPIEPWRIVRTRMRVQQLATGPIEGGGRAAGYFTGATGVLIYDGDLFPPEYLNNAFIGDAGGNLVHRKTVRLQGVRMLAERAEEQSEFLRSKDNWFRPVQFANAPDGALYVLDMYREVIEHPLSLPEPIKRHLDLDSGSDRGRLYRVIPEGSTIIQRTLPADCNTLQLCEMLSHRNGWHRETAARLLMQCDPKECSELLRKVIAEQETQSVAGSQAVVRALYLLAEFARRAQERIDESILLKALNHSSPLVRRHAIRIAESQINSISIPKQLCAMATDPDQTVRFQLALTLGELKWEIGESDAVSELPVTSAFVQLIKQDAGDADCSAAILSSISNYKGAILNRLADDETLSRQNQVLALVSEIASQIARERRATDLNSLAHLFVKFRDNPVIARSLLLSVADGAEGNLPLVRAAIEQEGFSFEDARALVVDDALKTVTDAAANLGDRLSAAEALRMAAPESFQGLLQANLTFQQPAALQIAMLRTAVAFPEDAIAKIILDRLVEFSPTVRDVALQTILTRTPWRVLLLDRLSDQSLPTNLLSAAHRQTLLKSTDKSQADRASEIFSAQQNQSLAEVLRKYQHAFSLETDLKRGSEVFKNKCSSCHRLENTGKEMGPNLAAFANRGAEAILLNVVDPNREVDPRYIVYLVELSDGRTLSGLLKNESAANVTLVDNQNQELSLLRSEIVSMVSTQVSLMPENLHSDIDEQAMADLIRYIIAQSQ